MVGFFSVTFWRRVEMKEKRTHIFYQITSMEKAFKVDDFPSCRRVGFFSLFSAMSSE